MEHFIGGLGKGNTWCLVSDCPFVVEDKKNHEFISVKTLEDCAKYYEQDAIYTVYAWNGGIWSEVHFLTTTDKPSKRDLGFRPPGK